MSNFKVGGSKFSRFVNGKGFYIALALCLVAIGTATYIAVNNSKSIVGDIKSASGISSAGNTATSIPDWDAQSGAEQTNAAVSGVPARTPSAPSSSAPSSSKPSSPSKPSSSTPSKSEPTKPSAPSKMVFAMPITPIRVTTAYSGDKPVFDKTMGDWRVHDGVDIAASEGTPVKACASGKVSDIKDDYMMGEEVIIDHGNGVQSLYANLTRQVTVKKGQEVEVGDTIGAVGDTAEAEIAVEPHLHFEIMKNGVDVDPLAFISGTD